MADRDALQIYVSEGWILKAAGIRRERNGNVSADLILENGRITFNDRGVINTETGRESWTARAAGSGRPADDELLDALLRLLPEALAQLQIPSGKPTQADQLVGMVIDVAGDFTTDVLAQVELFHTPDHEAYAVLPIANHRETWPVRSKSFKRWLSRRFYEQHEKAPSAQALQDAIGVLEGRALFDGEQHDVHVRVARHDNTIYIDLCDHDWRVVEITPTRWDVVDQAPVRFRRARGMLPLPTPISGGSLEALRPFVNVGSDNDWALLIAWLVAALRPEGPYPILALHGEQGSAKSSTARVLRSVVDPNSAPLRADPRDGRDLVIAARNGWGLCYDNLFHVPAWMSDAFCRLSTGGGFATRELYSDDSEVLFDATRPVILTGIEEVATRGDLLDRSIVMTLPSIPQEKRRQESDFWRAFEQVRPSILGALLTAVSVALAALPTVRLARLPRLADFAAWVTAAEPALGLESGAFMSAYATNRADANEVALEASPVAAEIMKLIAASGGLELSPTTLLAELDAQASDGTKRLKAWPKSARALSGAIKRLAPNLRRAGVDVTFDRTPGTNSQRIITIVRVERDGDAE